MTATNIHENQAILASHKLQPCDISKHPSRHQVLRHQMLQCVKSKVRPP